MKIIMVLWAAGLVLLCFFVFGKNKFKVYAYTGGCMGDNDTPGYDCPAGQFCSIYGNCTAYPCCYQGRPGCYGAPDTFCTGNNWCNAQPSVCPPNSQFISCSSVSLVGPGKTANFSVTIKNTGTSTWTAASNFRLGAVDSAGNPLGAAGNWGVNRVYMDPGATVSPGDSYTFNFTMTAPINPGSYSFYWRMLQEGVQWFGDSASNCTATVCPKRSCSDLGKDCGDISGGDQCGQPLFCGYCTLPETCGGAGIANVCGCSADNCPAWWQATGGDIYGNKVKSSIPDPVVCKGDCKPYMMLELD